MKKNAILVIVLTILALFIVQNASADDASDTIKSLIGKFMTYKNTAKANKAIERILDIGLLGQKAMSSHWSSLSGAQKKKFNDLLVKLVRKLAYTGCKEYFGNNAFVYGKVVVDGDIHKVPITVSFQGMDEPVTFYMKQKGNKWVIEDIELLDTTMVTDYRNQFNSIINKDGIDGLLKAMEKRLKN